MRYPVEHLSINPISNCISGALLFGYLARNLVSSRTIKIFFNPIFKHKLRTDRIFLFIHSLNQDALDAARPRPQPQVTCASLLVKKSMCSTMKILFPMATWALKDNVNVCLMHYTHTIIYLEKFEWWWFLGHSLLLYKNLNILYCIRSCVWESLCGL